MMRVRIKNLKEMEVFHRQLPKKLDKELSKGNYQFMDTLRIAVRLRAPKDTGELKESIVLEPVRRSKNVKQWALSVGAPHALFQEAGFTPHSFFAGEELNSSKLESGRRYFVSKWTPFVEPALQEQLKSFDEKLNSALDRAII